MNLQFTNKGGNFVSEFEVTSDFNLHIEGVRLSDMHIYQKTAGGSYAKVTDFPSERSQDRVADFDFASLVYPKFIKVVCATEPTYAEIATDGEVTEIKSQSKEVEITANGVTEIAPDAGFGYLSGVKVNVNVPTGGGDAPSGGSNYEYLDLRGIAVATSNYALIVSVAYLLNVEGSANYTGIFPTASLLMTISDVTIKGAMVDLSMVSNINRNKEMTAKEYILTLLSEDELNSIPRLTKEEFYTL
jgi:hypothetical protein